MRTILMSIACVVLFSCGNGNKIENAKLRLELAKEQLKALSDSAETANNRLVNKRMDYLLSGFDSDEARNKTMPEFNEWVRLLEKRDAVKRTVDSLSNLLLKLTE